MEAGLQVLAGLTVAAAAAAIAPAAGLSAAASSVLAGIAGNLGYKAATAIGGPFRRKCLDRWSPIDPNHHVPCGLRHAQIIALRAIVTSVTDEAQAGAQTAAPAHPEAEAEARRSARDAQR